MTRRQLLQCSAFTLVGASSVEAACTSTLDPQTAADYSAYSSEVRPKIEVPLDPANLPELPAGGEPRLWNLNANKPNQVLEVRQGVIIHWAGAVRMKLPTVDALSKLLSRYDMYAKWYAPYMAACRAVPTGAGQYRVTSILHDTDKPAAILPTLHFSFEIESLAGFRHIGNTANPTLLITNHAERIRESDTGHPEAADSRDPKNQLFRPDFGHGVLWRTDTQWRAIRSGDSVYAEYQSISLARSLESISMTSACAVLRLPGIRQRALRAMTDRPQKLLTTILRQTRDIAERS